jgi:hypothetical protein
MLIAAADPPDELGEARVFAHCGERPLIGAIISHDGSLSH